MYSTKAALAQLLSSCIGWADSKLRNEKKRNCLFTGPYSRQVGNSAYAGVADTPDLLYDFATVPLLASRVDVTHVLVVESPLQQGS
jgi:hypothetical protein